MADKRFSDEIREALNKCGMTRYRVWKLTGIDQTALMRFARGEAGMSLENVDRLAAALSLHVTTDRPKTTPRRPVPEAHRPQRRTTKKRRTKAAKAGARRKKRR